MGWRDELLGIKGIKARSNKYRFEAISSYVLPDSITSGNIPNTPKSNDQHQPDAREVVAEFGRQDPGPDCWQWVKRHEPKLWRMHMQALLADDLTQARLTYSAMVAAWGSRQDSTKSEGEIGEK